jgi:hypothetical protein
MRALFCIDSIALFSPVFEKNRSFEINMVQIVPTGLFQ